MGHINEWLERNEFQVVITLFFVIVIVLGSLLIHSMSRQNINLSELENERTYYEGNVTEVIFDDSIIIIELDNNTIVRWNFASYHFDEPFLIELHEEYRFGVNYQDYLVEYEKIGDE